MIRTTIDDTIAAISTPPGEGGIGIVRLSGPEAVSIAATVFRNTTGQDIRTSNRRVYHGRIYENEMIIDEVLVHVMRAPHSYTRQDVVEINGHGGAGPLNAILETVLRNGARVAEPGEFTRRAFLSGRIDLSQAEAVMDRIQAQTKAGLLSASTTAEGGLRRTIGEIATDLRSVKAQIESAVDFSEHDLPEHITPELVDQISRLRQKMKVLLDTADAGRLYREGATVAIAGRPNVGKSSLFNALLRESRAIVTEHAGTTRDALQEIINIEGIPVRLSDTAGLRTTTDEVEQIGVDVARKTMETASVVLLVVDGSEPPTEEDRTIENELRGLDIPILLVMNKSDLGDVWPDDTVQRFTKGVSISAKTGTGLGVLEQTLGRLMMGGESVSPSNILVTRIHQKDSLRRGLEAVDRLEKILDDSPEFMSMEVDDALNALGEITGETTPDDILDEIFARFCIGK